MGYLYVLKKLAYACFIDRKYSESEKYFSISNTLTPIVSKNPNNIYSSQKNMLLFYTYTNIDKAKQIGDEMIKDIEDSLPVHTKELCLLTGVIILIYFCRMCIS